MTDITQADRDAATKYDHLLSEVMPDAPELQELAKAFARHRIAAEEATERATIETVVGWLMNINWCSESHSYATAFADAIERGEWK